MKRHTKLTRLHLVVAFCLLAISAFGQLLNSSWPKAHSNALCTGVAPGASGIPAPIVAWSFANLAPNGDGPAIGPDGTVYQPDGDLGLVALNGTTGAKI